MARSIVLVLSGLVLAVGACLAPTPADAAMDCGLFVVGEANSSSYEAREVGGHAVVSRIGCGRAIHFAQAIHAGEITVPRHAFANGPRWGRRVRISDGATAWRCRFRSEGLSGQSYRARCATRAASVRWSVGARTRPGSLPGRCRATPDLGQGPVELALFGSTPCDVKVRVIGAYLAASADVYACSTVTCDITVEDLTGAWSCTSPDGDPALSAYATMVCRQGRLAVSTTAVAAWPGV